LEQHIKQNLGVTVFLTSSLYENIACPFNEQSYPTNSFLHSHVPDGASHVPWLELQTNKNRGQKFKKVVQ
jgi:hypothetical protein